MKVCPPTGLSPWKWTYFFSCQSPIPINYSQPPPTAVGPSPSTFSGWPPLLTISRLVLLSCEAHRKCSFVALAWDALFGESHCSSLTCPQQRNRSHRFLPLCHQLHSCLCQATNSDLISVGLVGYPNVGKSSVINTLRFALDSHRMPRWVLQVGCRLTTVDAWQTLADGCRRNGFQQVCVHISPSKTAGIRNNTRSGSFSSEIFFLFSLKESPLDQGLPANCR